MINLENFWKQPPLKPELSDKVVHIWRISFSEHLKNLDKYRNILNDEERARADRFYFTKDLNRFTIARGLLRMLLADYMSIQSEDIIFVYNQFGKPEIPKNIYCKKISFNISHSEDLALFAFAIERMIGVDVEFIRARVSFREIATRFFSPSEVRELYSLPDKLHKEAFFNGWTRKEAYIKAKGKGLAIPLDSFDVSLTPGKQVLLLDSRDEPGIFYEWFMDELFLGNDYKGAMIVEGKNLDIKCYGL